VRLFLSLLLVAACNSGEDDIHERDCDTSPLTYENYGAPYLLTWCVPCHSSELAEADRQEAPVEANYDSHQGVIDNLDGILFWAVESEEMPPVGGPTDDDKDLFAEWIECGAL
jgi:hypothetical protein